MSSSYGSLDTAWQSVKRSFSFSKEETRNPLVSNCDVKKCKRLGVLHIQHENKIHRRCIIHTPKFQMSHNRTLQCSVCEKTTVDIHIIDLRDQSVLLDDNSVSRSIIQPVTPVDSLNSNSVRHVSFDLESHSSDFQERTSRSCCQKTMICAALSIYGVGCYFLGMFVNNN